MKTSSLALAERTASGPPESTSCPAPVARGRGDVELVTCPAAVDVWTVSTNGSLETVNISGLADPMELTWDATSEAWLHSRP